MAGAKRFSRQSWLVLGLDVLRTLGADAIVLDTLCAQAGKTKGSFYFHFATVDAFTQALAEHWRNTFTLALIREADKKASPGARLDHLNTLAFHLDPAIEQNIRRLAARDQAVAAVVIKVDEERTAYLAQLYSASKRFNRNQAQALAQIEYAAFVGLQQTMPKAKPQDLQALYQNFLQLTGRT